jgi:hypothetical protein
MNGRKQIEEPVDGIAVVQVVEKCLRRNPCSLEDESAAHEFAVRVDRTVVECQHDPNLPARPSVVKDSLQNPPSFKGTPENSRDAREFSGVPLTGLLANSTGWVPN